MEIKRINSNEASLVTELFDEYRIFYKQSSDIKLAEKFIKERLEKNESIIFVAMIENIPAGFTQLYPTYSSVRAVKNWILNDLFVKEDFRKQGVGEELIRTAMNFAASDGATFIELETAKDNFNAQRLYESIGFTKQLPEYNFFTYRIPITRSDH